MIFTSFLMSRLILSCWEKYKRHLVGWAPIKGWEKGWDFQGMQESLCDKAPPFYINFNSLARATAFVRLSTCNLP